MMSACIRFGPRAEIGLLLTLEGFWPRRQVYLIEVNGCPPLSISYDGSAENILFHMLVEEICQASEVAVRKGHMRTCVCRHINLRGMNK